MVVQLRLAAMPELLRVITVGMDHRHQHLLALQVGALVMQIKHQ
jgi:hypothetical protein